MRVGVVGGGLFGSTAAIFAARAGHDVHLFEAKPELMCGATAGTYSRVHRGFHYPRHAPTGRESRRAEKSFRAEYGPAVIDDGYQFYVVPPHRSHVTVDEFRDFLDNENLAFSEDGGVFQVVEPRINLGVLQQMVRQIVHSAGVKVHLGARAPSDLRRCFDRVVVAAYSGINAALLDLDIEPTEYKFQVVERPVVRLPPGFRDTSIVVVDGPFGCIDPLDEGGLHVLGHVVHTIHASNTGYHAEVPQHLAPLIDQGVIQNPPATRFAAVVDDLARYVPDVRAAEHVGSSFVVRAVLAGEEKTDRRPTIITRHDRQAVSIFSGKLGTACRAATEVLAIIQDQETTSAPAQIRAVPSPRRRAEARDGVN